MRPLRFKEKFRVSKADVVWFDVFPKVAGYLKLGDHSMEKCNLESCHDKKDFD